MDEGFEVPHLGKALDFRLGLQNSNHCLFFVSQLLMRLGRAEEELGKAEPEWDSVLSSPEGVPVPSSCHQSQAQCKGTALLLLPDPGGSGFSHAPGHGIRNCSPVPLSPSPPVPQSSCPPVPLSPLLSGYRLSLSRSKQPIGELRTLQTS